MAPAPERVSTGAGAAVRAAAMVEYRCIGDWTWSVRSVASLGLVAAARQRSHRSRGHVGRGPQSGRGAAAEPALAGLHRLAGIRAAADGVLLFVQPQL